MAFSTAERAFCEKSGRGFFLGFDFFLGWGRDAINNQRKR
jgi:hypothetical protein